MIFDRNFFDYDDDIIFSLGFWDLMGLFGLLKVFVCLLLRMYIY